LSYERWTSGQSTAPQDPPRCSFRRVEGIALAAMALIASMAPAAAAAPWYPGYRTVPQIVLADAKDSVFWRVGLPRKM